MYLVTVVGVAWPVATWAMLEAAQPRASRSRATWRGLYDILLGPRGLRGRVSRNLSAVSTVGLHPFSVREPTKALDAHRDALVRPEWVVPARAAKPPAQATPHVGVGFNVRAAITYAGFVGFALRRGFAYVREVRASARITAT